MVYLAKMLINLFENKKLCESPYEIYYAETMKELGKPVYRYKGSYRYTSNQ